VSWPDCNGIHCGEDVSVDDFAEAIAGFVPECKENLALAEKHLLDLESGADPDKLNALFRAVHSIKGAAGFLELSEMEKVSHCAESLMDDLRNQRRPISREIVDFLLQAVDRLSAMADQPALGKGESVQDVLAAYDELAGSATPSPAKPEVPPEPAPVAPLPAAAAPATSADKPSAIPAAASGSANPTIRIGVDVLDKLLNHVGEVVLGRNQFLNQAGHGEAFSGLSQSITKLHQFVIQTRMQPVGSLFDRYSRTVRDLSLKLGKKVDLHVEGSEIGLDRTVLEALADPLVHLVRNAVDHGIETPEERSAKGKSVVGNVHIRALHESGQILIEVEDDGRGIDPEVIRRKAVEKGILRAEAAAALGEKELIHLIFHPGFSTKDSATAVSGRGVGMDVVKSNLEGMGCSVEIVSKKDGGTVISARIPLTMAVVNSSVISALIINVHGHSLAIPQMAVSEIIRLTPDEQVRRIEKMKDVEVFKLRDKIIPLVHLEDLLEIPRTYYDPFSRRSGLDKREQIVSPDPAVNDRRKTSIVFIVLQYKQNFFGILVDRIGKTEEIVVKRLPALLAGRSVFAGTTILGNGEVSLILDVNGMVEKAGLDFLKKQDPQFLFGKRSVKEDRQRIVVFNNAEDEYFAIPVNLLSEVDRFMTSEIHRNGNREFIRRHGESIPLLRLDKALDVSPCPPRDSQIVLIPARVSYPTGIAANRIVATASLTEEINTKEANVNGILGSIFHDNKLVMLLDIFTLLHRSDPKRHKELLEADLSACRILVVDDQLFFRQLIAQYFRVYGVKSVHVAGDGQEALDYLYKNRHSVDVVVSDIEMPVMDGYQLVSNVKSTPALRDLPVMALTSLGGNRNVQKGLDAGFDAYEVKLDKENVLKSLTALYQKATRK
jgi:two-component system, chemotaxis family, sensor kinase CheA